MKSLIKNKLLKTSFAIFITFSLTGCVTTMPSISLGEEEQVGRAIDYKDFTVHDYAKSIEGQDETLQEITIRSNGFSEGVKDIEDYIQSIANKLAKAGPAPDYTLEVKISNDPYTARTFTQGILILSLDYISQFETEDELAFLIAHEYSHFLLQHGKVDFIGQVSEYSQAAFTIYLISQGENDVALYLAGFGGDMLVRKFLLPGWSRIEENDADRLGVDLLVMAGYNSYAFEKTLNVIAEAEKQGKEDLENRSKLERELYASASKANASSLDTDQIIGAFKKGFSDIIDAVASEHESPEERYEKLESYVEQEYLANAQITMTPIGMKNFKRRIKEEGKLNQTLSALSMPDISYQDSQELIGKLSKSQKKRSYVRYVLAKNALYHNNPEPILALAKEAENNKDIGGATVLTGAKTSLLMRDSEQTLAILRQYPESAWPSMWYKTAIEALRLRGNATGTVHLLGAEKATLSHDPTELLRYQAACLVRYPKELSLCG